MPDAVTVTFEEPPPVVLNVQAANTDSGTDRSDKMPIIGIKAVLIILAVKPPFLVERVEVWGCTASTTDD